MISGLASNSKTELHLYTWNMSIEIRTSESLSKKTAKPDRHPKPSAAQSGHRINWKLYKLDMQGYPCISKDIHGCPWIFMDSYGNLWTFVDIFEYLWISLDLHGSPSISIDILFFSSGQKIGVSKIFWVWQTTQANCSSSWHLSSLQCCPLWSSRDPIHLGTSSRSLGSPRRGEQELVVVAALQKGGKAPLPAEHHHGYPWTSMDIHWYPLLFMDIHGYSQVSMEIQGYAWK